MENEDFIQQLLETKSFDSLTQKEREIVLSVMSQEEYIARGEIVELSKKMLHKGVRSMTPSPLVKNAVADLMEQRKQDEINSFWGMLNRLVAIKIPAYQFVIALALVIFLLPPLLENNIKEVADIPKTEKEISYLTDTVFIEKEVQKIVEVEKVRYIKVKQKPDATNLNTMNALAFFEEQSSVRNENATNLEFATEQFEHQLKNIGQSSADREDLNQFVIEIQ